jgi:hypothetical protein
MDEESLHMFLVLNRAVLRKLTVCFKHDPKSTIAQAIGHEAAYIWFQNK